MSVFSLAPEFICDDEAWKLDVGFFPDLEGTVTRWLARNTPVCPSLTFSYAQ